MSYQKLFEEGINQEPAKAWRASGKKALGVICAHVPLEIMYALDVLPVRLRATKITETPDADTWMSTFSCSFTRGILEYWMKGAYDLDGMVTTDGCMMPMRVYDNAEHMSKLKKETGKYFEQFGAPRIIMGSKAQGEYSKGYYVDELKRFIASLEAFTGKKLTDAKLKEGIDKYNEARKLVREVYELRKADNPVISGEETLKLTLAHCDYPIDDYIAMLKAFLADAKNRAPITGSRARLMVIGSALDQPGYIKVIEEKGGLVVNDSVCTGSRPFAQDVEVKGDVFESLALYYLDRLVCPRMTDNRIRFQKYIVDTCKAWNVNGVVYQKMQYCECWGGESMYLEPDLKAIGVPMLQVDREQHLANVGQLAIRAEAFIEMIEK